MELTTADITAWLASFIWPFVRIGAMFAAAPLFSSRMLPVRVRVVLALLLSMMLAPLIDRTPAIDPLGPAGMLIGLHQVLIGLSMGFILQLVFSCFAVAGEVIAMSMGLGFASMIDPQNGVQTPVLSSYFVIIATLVFLALDGHLALLVMVSESFQTLPLGTQWVGQESVWQLSLWASRVFSGAVLVALPALGAILMVNLTFGVITRAAPQLNIFAVGFPMTLILGFIFLLFSLPSLAPQVTLLLSEGYALMRRIIGG